MKSNQNLNSNLERLLKKHFNGNSTMLENEGFNSFIKDVNKMYNEHERDLKLHERATQLNDLEYGNINQILKKELNEKTINQEKLEKAIEKANKASKVKSEFLSIMSHEIRTPLNAIIGSVYLLGIENIGIENENIDILKTASSNLLLLINDILDFNKIEAGKLQLEKTPFNIKSLLEDLIRANKNGYQKNKNSFILNLDQKIAANVIGDPLRIGQILNNLISNANKFTKKGTITINVFLKKETKERIQLKLEVIDTGIGIKKEKLVHIFQPFTQEESETTRKFGGSGLGLVITKQLLNLYNSEIKVKSIKNIGSKFYFNIELEKINKFIEVREVNKDVITFKNLSVLIVDDNILNVAILSKIIKQWNIKYEVANNGKEAFEIAKKTNFHLILMDLSMPVMDGFEATVRIRNFDTATPIIAISASNYFNDLEKAIQLGFNDYIVKPFNISELNSKIVKHTT